MSQNIVHIENLVKRYGELTALNHLNLDIREGEIFGLLGPNGSGKTTAINCMLSLLKYEKGQIEIFGEPMRPDNYQVKKPDQHYYYETKSSDTRHTDSTQKLWQTT